jgi:hypothetical protein
MDPFVHLADPGIDDMDLGRLDAPWQNGRAPLGEPADEEQRLEMDAEVVSHDGATSQATFETGTPVVRTGRQGMFGHQDGGRRRPVSGTTFTCAVSETR